MEAACTTLSEALQGINFSLDRTAAVTASRPLSLADGCSAAVGALRDVLADNHMQQQALQAVQPERVPLSFLWLEIECFGAIYHG